MTGFMSFNQSRADRSDSPQYRKKGRSGSYSQRDNNYSGSTGQGGGAASPPPSSDLQPNQSFSKKSNYAQGGQSRASGYGMISNPDSNSVPANRLAPDDSHLQSPAPAPSASVTGSTVKQTTDQPAQKSAQVVRKADNVEPYPAPQATSTKDAGAASKSIPIQFGSISSDSLNEMRGIMHQGQGLNLMIHMGQRMPPQLGNMGMCAAPQFLTLQPSKYVRSNKPVKITHPVTHEELKLENVSGPRSHQNVPQPLPATLVPYIRPINYYPCPGFYSAQGPVPLNSTINLSSQPPPRFRVLTPISVIPSPDLTLRNEEEGVEHINAGLVSLSAASGKERPDPRYRVVNPISVIPSPDLTLRNEEEGSKHINSGLVSLSAASGKEKPVPELSSSKKSRGKKKLKLILQKNNVAGKASDLHNVYKGPEEKKEIVAASESNNLEVVWAASVDSNADNSLKTTSEFTSSPRQEDSFDNFRKYKTLVSSVSIVPDAYGSTSTVKTLASSDGDHSVLFPEASTCRSESLDSKPDVATSIVSDDVVAPVFSIPSPDLNLRNEEGSKNAGLVSLSAASGKEKHVPELSRSKGPRGKKKLKGILQKADAARKTSDLYNAYKTPEEKKETISSSENNNLEDVSADSVQDDVCSSEKEAVGNVEPGDWEDATDISTPKLETADTINTVSGRMNNLDGERIELIIKKYTRDFLLKFRALCTDLAEDFEITSHVADGLMVPNVHASCESYLSPGRVVTKSPGGRRGPIVSSKDPKGKKKKKKLKGILQKADTAGKTSDLDNAYSGPEEKKETIAASESNNLDASADSVQNDVCLGEKEAVGKVEPDDWEYAVVISTPKLETADTIDTVSGGSNNLDRERIELIIKKYTRDFLLELRTQCADLADGFEITSHVADALMVPNVHASCESYPSPGRVVDQVPGGRRGPLVSGHSLNGGGMRSTSFHEGLIISPTTTAPVMHKAEKKYQVGKISDEEEAKQRQLKAILNKLTPQNLEKLFEQVKAVNINDVATLTGVISQIFYKALMEPTFCELYANFCYHLAGELPDFCEDNEKITFKRLLINKCRGEFKRGEREQEADRADAKSEVKQSLAEREGKRFQMRSRMLGNIRFMGELYKKRMLTERIMHKCIKKLLGQYQNPVEDNIEALCKLMSTIGEMIDHPKAKDHMDAYFDMMSRLSNNMKVSSRVRFMLKDAIDLRKNNWQQRKVEGPKKIDEVHREDQS